MVDGRYDGVLIHCCRQSVGPITLGNAYPALIEINNAQRTSDHALSEIQVRGCTKLQAVELRFCSRRTAIADRPTLKTRVFGGQGFADKYTSKFPSGIRSK